MGINNFGFGLNPWMTIIDDAAKFATLRAGGTNVATAAAAAVSVNGGLNVLPGGNGVQTWNTVSASAAAAVAVGPGATATATATAGNFGAQAAAGAGAAGSVFAPQPLPGPQRPVNLALDGIGKILSGLGELLQAYSGVAVNHPNPADCGGLKADAAAGAVTTSGGYKIEATGKFEWKITGPDGKSTRIWGDPHVAEGDGGKWDFKKDSTFVLGDGTKVHVKTQPYGNGATVTSALQIEKNGQLVDINGIAEGKGKVGEVRQGPATFATEQQFLMGKETDDWSFQGKEILGDNGADKFKLGNDLAPGAGPQAAAGAGANAGGGIAFAQSGAAGGVLGGAGQMSAGAPAGTLGAVAQQGTQLAQGGGMLQLLTQVLGILQSLIGLLANQPGGNNPYYQPQPAQQQPQPAQTQPAQPTLPQQPTQPAYDPNQHRQGLTNAFYALGSMFVALGQTLQLASQVPQQPRALNG